MHNTRPLLLHPPPDSPTPDCLHTDRDLHRILGVNSGDEVLYVGDHIFGDIVTSKK